MTDSVKPLLDLERENTYCAPEKGNLLSTLRILSDRDVDGLTDEYGYLDPFALIVDSEVLEEAIEEFREAVTEGVIVNPNDTYCGVSADEFIGKIQVQAERYEALEKVVPERLFEQFIAMKGEAIRYFAVLEEIFIKKRTEAYDFEGIDWDFIFRILTRVEVIEGNGRFDMVAEDISSFVNLFTFDSELRNLMPAKYWIAKNGCMMGIMRGLLEDGSVDRGVVKDFIKAHERYAEYVCGFSDQFKVLVPMLLSFSDAQIDMYGMDNLISVMLKSAGFLKKAGDSTEYLPLSILKNLDVEVANDLGGAELCKLPANALIIIKCLVERDAIMTLNEFELEYLRNLPALFLEVLRAKISEGAQVRKSHIDVVIELTKKWELSSNQVSSVVDFVIEWGKGVFRSLMVVDRMSGQVLDKIHEREIDLLKYRISPSQVAGLHPNEVVGLSEWKLKEDEVRGQLEMPGLDALGFTIGDEEGGDEDDDDEEY
ncbi:hypothetical protein HOG48_00420 [Candidatus Peregrinibacteria bacterium]|nr:hypothetical protein [Candidatus Peregrinibacteria bacterium]